MAKKLLLPKDVTDWLTRRYANQHRAWLLGDGQWPLTVNLGVPTESDVTNDTEGVRRWVDAWESWRGPYRLSWASRQWPRLGTQNLPAILEISGPNELASLIGQGERWRTAAERYQRFVEQWPQLKGHAVLGRNFGVLADYTDVDFVRLFSMLDWLEKNPCSGLAPRQLPVVGLDTKWMEKRTGLITDFLRSVRDDDTLGDFYSLCGLRRPAPRIRLRVLCPKIRQKIGELCDIESPLLDLARLAIHPRHILIVENLETGLALPDMEGVVAFMRLGNAVTMLAALPWLQGCDITYWGDIDTHGYAILNRARGRFPNLVSVLMDQGTFLSYRDLWVEEDSQCSETILPSLMEHENVVFNGLKNGLWGNRLRLEQERIPWPVAIEQLGKAVVSAQP